MFGRGEYLQDRLQDQRQITVPYRITPFVVFYTADISQCLEVVVAELQEQRLEFAVRDASDELPGSPRPGWRTSGSTSTSPFPRT